MHAAVTGLIEGDDAPAPGLVAIGAAIGDPAQPFNHFVSPLARMIDWLAARYGVLFLVSGGNHLAELGVPADVDLTDPAELEEETLRSLWDALASRRVLSPAEAMNAVTIGAAHSDQSAIPADGGRTEPLVTSDLPNVVSALGGGYGRSTKPDILMPGGRQLVRPVNRGTQQALVIEPSRRPPGIRAAAPPVDAGETDRTAYICGTSPAVGIALNQTFEVLRRLDEFFPAGQTRIDRALDGALVKALLVHPARWGTAAEVLASVVPDGRQRRDAIGRFLGYGRADLSDPLICDDHRVTAVANGEIADGEEHVYRFPVPEALRNVAQERRLSVTLAWLTPANPRHRRYRRAALRLFCPTGRDELCADREDAGNDTAARGTVQHEVLSGSRAVELDGDALELRVTCRADAGALETPVPYALVVTLEVPEEAELPIYQQVRDRLRLPIRIGRR